MNYAEKLLTTSFERYRDCATYNDSGSVKHSNSTNHITFETTFGRPNQFSFQWVNLSEFSERRKNRIWTSNNSVYAQYDFQKEQSQVSNIAEEVTKAAGISSGASVVIVPLLLRAKDIESCRLLNLQHVKELPTEQINGVPCHCIIGSVLNEGDTQVWLSENDFTVRRIREFVLVTRKAHNEAVKKIEALTKTRLPSVKHFDRYHVDYDFAQVTFNSNSQD